MRTPDTTHSRRDFLRSGSILAAGLGILPLAGFSAPAVMSGTADNINFVGPKPGYSPQIGTLVSMMNWMRNVVLMSVQGMHQEELDFLFDDKANTIGAMLLHLAATERFYQMHCFDGLKWGAWPDAEKKRWHAASELGDAGRKEIKGHDLKFYLDTLDEVRNHTLEELKKRDDQWLLATDDKWFWGPTNNYCKFFHVVEHESNHNGQIKWLRGRYPGAKKGNES
ncbi:DinB family protein [Chitinophaga vietnamensis]|uniref:DinB family protein n=1 Tax=Chitinophaga vietnamensis TaxID=2593957 RepID=UPI001177390C|nr:DUF664 domain-containing protein [Chitinophaga vietnamensis]